MSDNKQQKQSSATTPRQKTYDPRRAAQEARRAAKRANARSRAARQRAVARARARSRARGILGWLSWWATYEMDRRAKDGDDDDITTATPVGGSSGTSVSAGGRDVTNVGGGFAWLREWGTRRTVAVLTLLVLAGFTGSIALGAGSIVVGIIAFVFFTAALALATAARARYQYRRRPADIQPPLEPVSDFHIEDMEIDEPDPDTDVNSLDDLERSFEGGTTPKPPSTDENTAEPDESTQPTAESAPASPDTPADTEAHVTTTTETKSARVPRMREAEPSATQPPATADSKVVTGLEAEHDEPHDDAKSTEGSVGSHGADSASTVVLNEVEAPLSASTAHESNNGSDKVREKINADSSPAAPTSEQADTTALSLLAAETPGQDLLAAYTASETHLPPEAVRDVAATLIVSDLDRSLMFYTQLLGLVEVDRARDAVLLEAGFGRVLLWRRDDAPRGGDSAMHLTFEVGNIDAAYQFLRTKGVVFTHAPRSALAGHVHELRAASFLDPDGHGLAITQLREH